MRRTVLTVLSVMMSATVLAQGYVRIDTVIRPYIQFDYRAWIDSGKPLGPTFSRLTYCYCHPDSMWADYVCGDLLQYNYLEDGADVCGLSVWLLTPGSPHYNPHPGTAVFWPAEYLYLYEATPDTFEEKGKLMIDLYVAPTNLHGIWPRNWNNLFDCDTIMGYYEVDVGINHTDLYEYQFFFDKPIHVEDSFYVGMSSSRFEYLEFIAEHPEEAGYIDWVYEGVGLLSTMGEGYFHYHVQTLDYFGEECLMPYMKQKIRWRKEGGSGYSGIGPILHLPIHFPLNEWAPTQARDFWMIFPLIKTYDTIWTVDTPACLPVRDFSIMSRYGDTVMLRWSPLEGRSEFQVSYGPEGMDPDSGTLVNVTSNRWRFIDTLHTGEVMTAYVRTVCRELDTLRFSEWSEGVEWQTRVGIVQPDEDVRLSSRIHLQPNPAKERVEVVTPCGVKGIEVYGSYGIRWREFPAGTAAFDVSDWAKGTYVVVIRTLAGSVTKKLVVE